VFAVIVAQLVTQRLFELLHAKKRLLTLKCQRPDANGVRRLCNFMASLAVISLVAGV
jgi:hypothetical protein